jgi:hypothetical protein
MAFDYDALEVELVGVLNSYFGANNISDGGALLDTVFNARQMPENQVELLQDYEKSLVNVQYVDSIFQEPMSTSSIVQEETIKVICYLQCNMMKGDSGGYRLIGCVKDSLMGYEPANARTRMWISNYGDWNIVDGQLNPFIEFSFRTMAQQVIDDTEQPLPGSGPLVEVDSSLYANGNGPL